jgi:hypothetical protein
MSVYVYRNGKLVEKHLAPPLAGGSAAPNVISDIMPETRHMVTGRYHTSKAAFRAETKAAGCVEVGNDPAITRPRIPVPLSREKRVEDIKRTIHALRNGNRA